MTEFITTLWMTVALVFPYFCTLGNTWLAPFGINTDFTEVYLHFYISMWRVFLLFPAENRVCL